MKKFILLIILLITMSGCSSKNKMPVINELNDLNGTKMGCMSGSIFDMTIEDNFDNCEIIYFNSRAELLLGLKSDKISGYLSDEPVAMLFKAENEDIDYFKEPIDYVDYGICFSDNANIILRQFNDYLKEVTYDGYLKSLQDKWICEDGRNQLVPEYNLTGENGTIRAVTTPDAAPFSFLVNNEFEGYEVELLKEFCYRYGYDLQIDLTSFDALISSVASNKYDISFNGIYITEERKKSVDFCDSTYRGSVVAVVKVGEETKVGFLQMLENKLHATFVEEDRWKLIVDGMLTTLCITVASIFFGTIFGFIIYFIARDFGDIAKKIVEAITYTISGLPVVVLLMILFYVVFAESKLSGTVISIIGFSLIFGSAVYKMLKVGVSAIDKGQLEGALALGYSEPIAFAKIVLPQAIRIVLPTYRSEIVSLIKSTSIVGYVTVQDLTRVSDIIRSRTYDAFFPLIVTAIIYFLLAHFVNKFISKLNKNIAKDKTEEEILKKLK